MTTAVTEQSFDEEVLQSDKPVLDRIVEDRNGDLKLVKVNIDEQPALSLRYGVQSIPTIILFKDGEPAAAAIGAQPKPALERALGLADSES